MAGTGSKKQRLREVAIAALLEHPTIATAAQASDISESTLRRWLRDDAFASAYEAARRKVIGQTLQRLQISAAMAVDTLIRNLSCGRPTVEVTAARVVLDQAVRSVELLEVMDRLDRLETAVNKRGEKRGI